MSSLPRGRLPQRPANRQIPTLAIGSSAAVLKWYVRHSPPGFRVKPSFSRTRSKPPGRWLRSAQGRWLRSAQGHWLRFVQGRWLRFFREMASVRAGTMGSVRTGAMGSVRTGTMGSVRSRRFSFTGFILRSSLAQFCAAVVASFSDTPGLDFWRDRARFLARLDSLRRCETTPSTAHPIRARRASKCVHSCPVRPSTPLRRRETTPSTAPPIRARRASKCVHSCQVRPSSPAPSRTRFFRALGSVRAGAMGSVRTGAMGSVRSRRFSFAGFILRRASAQFCAAVVASFSDTLWLHFLTRLGSVSGAKQPPRPRLRHDHDASARACIRARSAPQRRRPAGDKTNTNCRPGAQTRPASGFSG